MRMMTEGNGGGGLVHMIKAVGKHIVKHITDSVVNLVLVECLVEFFPNLLACGVQTG